MSSGSLYIIDTHAWVEYFLGSKKGEKVRKLLENEKNVFATIECCLAELRGWCLREEKDFDKFYRAVRANSTIIPVLLEHWLSAAEVKFQMRKTRKGFGLIDALLLVRQKELKCHVVSGDPHFKDLPNIVFLQ